jgi:hypothetical protein
MRLVPFCLPLAFPRLCSAEREPRFPTAALATAAQLREQALADDTGWQVVESLTTEVGPRMAGSEADARAVAWAKAKFKALGFDKVWTEPVTFPKWVRRSERAAILGAHAQPLTITALGGSPAARSRPRWCAFRPGRAGSGARGLAGRQDRLRRLPDGARAMAAATATAARSAVKGPSAAIRKGAQRLPDALGRHRQPSRPHTGITRFDEGLTPVPAAALTIPDADQLLAPARTGEPVTVRSRWTAAGTANTPRRT